MNSDQNRPQKVFDQIVSTLKSRNVSLINLFLDFDGTLVDLSPDPDHNSLTTEARSVLSRLQGSSKIHAVIISGRDHTFLKERTSGLAFDLSSEHGAELHPLKGDAVFPFGVRDTHWVSVAEAIMQKYVKSIPKSKIEKKTKSICWHYRMADASVHEKAPSELEAELNLAIQVPDVHLYHGKHVVELKASNADKGKFVKWYLNEHPQKNTVAIAIGDDVNDEAMFEAVNEVKGISIKVGPGKSSAKCFVASKDEVIELLRLLSKKL